VIDLLLVDDEPAVLEGLEHQLRPMRDRWRMTFALGGGAALAALDSGPFDVVVSDMRMPGVDGLAVIERARERHPSSIRLILSGEVGSTSVARLLATAHQVLTKPCPPTRLRATIDRALAVRAAVSDPAVRTLVSAVGELPPAPRLWATLGGMLRRSDVGAGAIARVLSEDPVLTARLIRLAGSVVYGGARVSSVVDAVRVLGTEAVHGMVLSLELGSKRQDPALDRIYEHGLRTAVLARALARPADAEAAFAAAIMHDIGQVVLTIGRPRETRALVEEARRSGRPLAEVERAALGTTHAEIGAYLLGLWDMPQPLIEAVALHHKPEQLPVEFGLAGVVYVANLLGEGGPQAAIDPDYLTRAGLDDQVTRWRSLARPHLEAS
jgi:putative nucleotidyltransferase with HDIG domain